MVEKLPHNMKAYFAYYKFLKLYKMRSKIETVTTKMMNAIEDSSVPTDEWMEAHILRADALVYLDRIEEAITTLEKLVSIIPPLPIPGLSYLTKLERKQMVDLRETENLDGSIKFAYDTQIKNSKSVDPEKAVIEERPEFEDSDDEEEKGAITIKVTPSVDAATIRQQQRFKELDLSDKNKVHGGRNARPFSSSLFLSTPKAGVSYSNL